MYSRKRTLSLDIVEVLRRHIYIRDIYIRSSATETLSRSIEQILILFEVCTYAVSVLMNFITSLPSCNITSPFL